MRPNVFSVPPGLPFLPTLADAILSGRVIPGFPGEAGPLALSTLTIYVPTRRAVRGLLDAFVHRLGGAAAILPAVKTLGEAEETMLEPGGGTNLLLPTVDEVRRRVLLARLVRGWKTELDAAILHALSGEHCHVPASSADALWLARDLAALLDEMTDEQASVSALAGLVPDRLAEWWQLTLTFLEILTRHWPEHLAANGLLDRAAARNLWLDTEAARLGSDGSAGPVVVAGSAATAPALLGFLKAVANLPNGAVVLPGLDRHLDASSWDSVDRRNSAAAPGHPQHGLKRVINDLLVDREWVEDLGAAPPALAVRAAFLSDALRPADTTHGWAETSRHPPEALDGLALVEADDEREEALAIAVAMRDALADPTATAALATPDRNLARRVAAELERFGVAANDSAGRPLAATAPGTLATLALRVALQPGDPIDILSLLKHPLTRLGFSPSMARRAARTIELVALRGGTGTADVADLAALYRRRRAGAEAEGARPHRAVRLLFAEDRDHAADAAARLVAALEPLLDLRHAPHGEIAPFADALTRTLEALAANEEGEPDALYASEAGAATAEFLRSLLACPPAEFAFAPAELPDVVAALASDVTVRPRGGLSSRVFIWGALEARLQNVDLMVLGGLNEGTWPQAARGDAFLSRPMRAELALGSPERRIGLAAHDFWMATGNRRVVFTRARRAGGAPSVPSRWLQRLLTRAGDEGVRRLREEGEVYLHHARLLDAGSPEAEAPRPEPRPPLDARPNRFAVTEVETLIRDPYAVFARRVLRLEPLEGLIRAPGAAERGSLYHAILATFAAEKHDPAAPDALDRLLTIARTVFRGEELPPEVEAVWWPRMETLAANLLAWERARDVSSRHPEVRGEWHFADLGVTLTGVADRIDRMADGRVEILDFKTGTNPSVVQARALLAPQLPLEGALAALGAFADLGGAAEPSDLLYVRLRERDFYDEALSHPGGRGAEPVAAADLGAQAMAKFRDLVLAYRDPAKPYASRVRPAMAGDFSGPYDHLARAREWTAAGQEAEMAEEAE